MQEPQVPGTSGSDDVLVSIDDHIGLVTLNRPEEMNAFTKGMTHQYFTALSDLDENPDVRAIVVTGNGRVFSAGATLKDKNVFAHEDGDWKARTEQQLRGQRPWLLNTPVIGAINGSAVGMGLTYPMLWDIRFMAQDAKYAFIFNRRGIIPEAGSHWLLPRLVGLSRATELLMTGRYFNGHEAEAIGFATRALPADQVLDAALDCARDIATNTAPLSVAITKRMLYGNLESPDRAATSAVETEVFDWVGKQEDAAEGVRAFVDKRNPEWRLSKHDNVPALSKNAHATPMK